MKKIKHIIAILFCIISIALKAQNVGIGTLTPNTSALLELQSTNKGLLLPRVADTNAVNSPAKGLVIFSNASNSLWVYNGANWQSATGGAATDALWEANGDSIAFTTRKFIRINNDQLVQQSVEGLTINGSLVVQQKTTSTNTAPTAAQTVTMDNTSGYRGFLVTDSAIRIFDPGGANANYNNNMQGNIIIGPSIATFNPADFGISVGDTLWISPVSFPNCRTNYSYLFTNTTTAPPPIFLGDDSYFIFRSNADNLNGKGFDIVFKRLYPIAPKTEFVTPGGKGLFFNTNNGAFRAGDIGGGYIAKFSAAIGELNIATAASSIAMGYKNSASGVASIAMGINTKATNDYAIAMGRNTNATGFNSFALGNYSIAAGEKSIAMGNYLNAKSYNSLALGSFNDTLSGTSDNIWLATDPLLYIGNSNNSSTRSNAMVVYKNADVDINGYTRLGKLSEGAPVIKMKEITLTSAATATGQSYINHGLTASKIISVNTLLEWTTGYFAPPEYSADPLLRYNYFVSPTQIFIQNNAASCAYICNKTVKVLITYKE